MAKVAATLQRVARHSTTTTTAPLSSTRAEPTMNARSRAATYRAISNTRSRNLVDQRGGVTADHHHVAMLVERGEHIVPIGASERGKVDVDHRRRLLGRSSGRRRRLLRRCPWRRRRADWAHSSRPWCQTHAQQTSCATRSARAQSTPRHGEREHRSATRSPARRPARRRCAPCANDAMISDNSACDAMLTERAPRVCTSSPSGVRTHAPSPADTRRNRIA
jgi:hypothetical protein